MIAVSERDAPRNGGFTGVKKAKCLACGTTFDRDVDGPET